MGLLDKLFDKAAEKLSGKETIRLPYEQMVGLVKDEFITGAEDEYLDYVLKIAKGMWYKKDGKNFFNLLSSNGRYLFKVLKVSGSKKSVWIEDNETGKFYQLDKDKDWKKFYKEIETAVKMEKINRNR